jgi:hypothetical protein
MFFIAQNLQKTDIVFLLAACRRQVRAGYFYIIDISQSVAAGRFKTNSFNARRQAHIR